MSKINVSHCFDCTGNGVIYVRGLPDVPKRCPNCGGTGHVITKEKKATKYSPYDLTSSPRPKRRDK